MQFMYFTSELNRVICVGLDSSCEIGAIRRIILHSPEKSESLLGFPSPDLNAMIRIEVLLHLFLFFFLEKSLKPFF